MGKITYLAKRIVKMNYKNFFKTIHQVHQKTGKNKIGIFFDIAACGFKYQAGYIDYYQFEMYKMNRQERKTIVTRGINNKITKKYNNMKEAYKFEDKALFNELFDEYLNRDWILLKDNEEEFKEFLKNKKEIIVKPLSLSCGKGVEKLNVSKVDANKLYHKLVKNGQVLVEEVAMQNQVLNNVYAKSVNTLRIVTLNKKVVAALLRIGNHGNVVDNFNHGGMVTTIDIRFGKVKYPAIDKEKNVYYEHPMTKAPIVGLQIPMWEDVKKLCIDACEIVPEIGYVGWDVCLGPTAPCLIEGNDFPGHDLYQLPVHRKGNTGLLPLFEEAMKGDKK